MISTLSGANSVLFKLSRNSEKYIFMLELLPFVPGPEIREAVQGGKGFSERIKGN